MTEKNFIDLFNRRKKAFLKDIESGQSDIAAGGTPAGHDVKHALDRFERWLKEEKEVSQKIQPISSKSFDEFIDQVLGEAQKLLSRQNINIVYTLPGQSLGIAESWKCVKVFENINIHYRIGRTRPRKGPSKGQDLLVLDLVMDGHKKQVFLPLLEMKSEIEKKLGSPLERELPKVESTGKYRLKIHLPIESAQGDVTHTAHKFAHFISVTKPILNQFGII